MDYPRVIVLNLKEESIGTQRMSLNFSGSKPRTSLMFRVASIAMQNIMAIMFECISWYMKHHLLDEFYLRI